MILNTKLKYIHSKLRLALNYTRKVVGRLFRMALEPLGISVFSKPARGTLDNRLAQFLPRVGTFIEVGATDGFSESNTYYLERFKKWNGVLIEPIPSLYKRCVGERPKSKVFNCALVSNNYRGETVVMKQGHLMSTVKGALGGEEKEHLEKAKYFHGVSAIEIEVPARTLTSVLDEAGVIKIDFFSLDVEGYELNVLRGLDFNTYRPTYMLIEFLSEDNRKEVETYISNMYNFVEKLSKRDYLYESNNSFDSISTARTSTAQR